MLELTTLKVETAADNGLVSFAAEPVEKPDARLLALDCHSPPTLVSQSISRDHLTLVKGTN
jgi:hypothetical protein